MKLKLAIVFFVNLLFLSVCFGQLSASQQHKLDSINRIIIEPSHDTAVARAYVDLTDILYVLNFDTVIVLCKKSVEMILPKLEEEISEKERRSYMITLAGAYNNIGFVYDDKGDVVMALDYYHKALKIREDIDDKPGIGETLNNIGIIYFKQGEKEKALSYYHKSLGIKEQLGNKRSISISLNNIGAIYREMGQIVKALDYYKRALTIRREIDDKRGIATSLSNIGSIYKSKNNIDTALYYYYESLAIRKNLNNRHGLVKVLTNVCAAELENGNVETAKKNGLESIKIAKELGYSEGLKYAAKTMSDVYKKENNWKEAFNMKELYVLMKDSIRNNNTELATMRLIAKYDLEQADKEYKLLEKENAIKELQSNKNENVIIFLIVAFILTLILAVLIYRGNIKKDIINNLLESQKEEALKQNDEKIILLKEIHHRVKNSLQVVSSLLRLQASEVDDVKVISMFEETQNRVISIAKLHEQMYSSDNLKEIDINQHFVPLINDLVEEYMVGTKVDIDINLCEAKMGADTLVPLGLIINEMISNSFKYAFEGREKGSIKVHIKHLKDNFYEMIIGDDGVGMSVDFKFEEATSLGTQLIQIFTEQLNGTIDRLEESGTFFRIVFEKQDS